MLYSRGLIFGIVMLSTASAQFISLPQSLQPNAFQELNQVAAEQSRYDLNRQLAHNAASKSTVQVKPIFVPIIVSEQAFQALTSTQKNQRPISGSLSFTGAEASIFAALNAPNNNFPDYITSLVKNPSNQESTQSSQRVNVSDATLKDLPQLLYDLAFYNSPLPRDDKILNEKNDRNMEALQGIKDILEVNTKPKPTLIESNPSAHNNDEVLLTDDGVNKILYQKPQTQTGTLLQNLLQRLNTRRRIQERLGAVYLRESLLNRK